MVFAKANPTLKLVIRRYIDRVYYCKVQKNPGANELVYFDRELVEDHALALANKQARKQIID